MEDKDNLGEVTRSLKEVFRDQRVILRRGQEIQDTMIHLTSACSFRASDGAGRRLSVPQIKPNVELIPSPMLKRNLISPSQINE